jgi:uncharacterized protein
VSAGRGSGPLVRAMVYLVQLYRTMISPLRPPSCRFTPTCSQYAVDALQEYGFARGGWLAIVRLAKCGPWHRGGWDPIPERSDSDTPERSDVIERDPKPRSDSLV